MDAIRRVVWLVFALPIAFPVFAQYELSVSSNSAEPGTSVEVSAFLDSSRGAEVEALTFGVCSVPAQVVPVSVEAGRATTLLNGGGGPDFFDVELFPRGVTLGLVASFVGGVGFPPAEDHQILSVRYEVLAADGTNASLQFCSTLGSPPTDLVVVAQGSAATPSTVAGQIQVVESPVATYRLELPELAHRGDTLGASVRLDAGRPVEAFTLGIVHDDSQFTLEAIESAGVLAASNGGAGPDLFVVNRNPAGGVGGIVGCRVSTQAPFETLPAALDQKILTFIYSVLPSAGPVCQNTTIDFTGGLGDPMLPLEVLTPEGVAPAAAIKGSITIAGPRVEPPSGGYTLRAGFVEGAPGREVSVPVSLDNEAPVQAFSFGVTCDRTQVTLEAVDVGLHVASLNCGAGPDFFTSALLPEGATVGCLFRLQPPFGDFALEPGGDHEIVRLLIAIGSNATSASSIEFDGTLGSPPVPIVVTVNFQMVVPALASGAVTVAGAVLTRRDCNNDGGVNLADVIFFLGNLFPQAGVPHRLDCRDACDANDDGSLNIADVVLTLDSLFGTPPTPAPLPSPCEPDETIDGLDCVGYANCP